MRRIIFILLGISIISDAVAQNTLDRVGLSSATPAASAYSLRLLSTAYSGAAIQVRRSSDNALQDIGFTAGGDLDTVALKTFVSADNGTVERWYDQSGNGLDAMQASQGNQPLIVNAGVIERTNNTPYLSFAGDRWFSIAMSFDRSIYPAATVNLVYQNTSLTGSQALWGCDDGGWDRFQLLSFDAAPGIAYGLSNGGGTTPNATNNTNRNVYTAIMNNTVANASYVVLNGVTGSLFTENGAGSTGNMAIGAIAGSGAYGFIGNISEFVLFTSSLPDPTRQTLEFNQANYYSLAAPVITTQPSNIGQNLCINATATALSVSATGTGPLTYQWYSNTVNSNTGGTPISGAANSTYTPSAAATGTTYYYVLVADGGFAVTSNVSAAITVDAAPVVSISPPSATIRVGESVALTAMGATSYLWGAGNATPLDQVSGYRMAVGLRRLRSSYSGPAIRLRRAIDNAEADFSFSGSELDMAAINLFLGGSNGYCVTLYDQAGLGNNMTQANASEQPLFVAAGLNGKPVLRFTTSQVMSNGTNFTPPFTVIYCAMQTGPSRQRVLTCSNNWLLGWWNGDKGKAHFDGWITPSGGSPADNNAYVYSGTGTGSISSVYENGVLLASNSGGLTGPNAPSFNLYERSHFDVTELFIFNTVLADADREIIENSTASYYAVFGAPPVPGASLLVSPTGTTTYNVTGFSANGGCAVQQTAVVTVLDSPGLGNFPDQLKTYYDSAYTISTPLSSSNGAFTYSSSNPAVAVISGSQVLITGTGVATITAVQAASGGYYSDSISSTVTVTSVAVVSANGEISADNYQYVNKYGELAGRQGVDANGAPQQTKSGFNGLTPATASSSAYQIKQDYPQSVDGLYWISNPNINGGTPVQIYADMTTDGGGWTLILCNKSPNPGWDNNNALLRNENTPGPDATYSIIAWADYIKKSSSGFQYMMDAQTRGSNGGIWTANSNYSFVSTSNANTDITLNTKFGTWNYSGSDIEPRMPWYSPGSQGLITTSSDANSDWWGTLIASGGWDPAPWLGSTLQSPGVIWYWVR